MILPDFKYEIIITALVIWNIAVFAMYGIDKHNAKKNKRRISEKTLLFSAFFIGGAGALLGMRVFRHKTQHLKFKIGVPLLFILNIAVVCGCIYILNNMQY